MTEPLVSYANSVSPPSHVEGRRLRHRLRAVASRLGYGRVKHCGRKRVAPTVTIRKHEGRCSVAGFHTCGSIWSCPVCAGPISKQRQEEVATALERAKEEGGAVYMMAFTAPHYRGQKLRMLRSRIANGWRKMLSGSPWGRVKADFGVSGYIKALEVTHGVKNGWHVHIHVLFFLDRELSELDRARMEMRLFDRWNGIVQREGSEPCNPAVFQLDRAKSSEAAGDYVAKWGSDYEITHLHSKTAKGGGRSPFKLLDLASQGYEEAGKHFGEYSRAMHGSRQLTWSRGLKDRFGIGETEDEDIAATVEGEDIAVIEGKEADAVVRAGKVCGLLEAAERGGEAAVRAFIESLGHGVRSRAVDACRAAYFGGDRGSGDGEGSHDPDTGEVYQQTMSYPGYFGTAKAGSEGAVSFQLSAEGR